MSLPNICIKHSVPLILVCDEYLCGCCYGNWLEKEPLPKELKETKGPTNITSNSKDVVTPVVLIQHKTDNPLSNDQYWVFPSLEDALAWAKEYAHDLEWHTQIAHTAKDIVVIKAP